MSTVEIYSSLPSLKSAQASGAACLVGASVPDGFFFFTSGNFTGRDDDINIVKANSVTLSSGAWVRERSSLLSYQRDSDSSLRTAQAKMTDILSVKDFGAIADGNPHPLSERFATLPAAQAVYPFATSLTQSIDYCAIIAGKNALVDAGGGVLEFPSGNYYCSDEPNLAAPRVSYRGIGRVVIQAGHDGLSVVRFDVGDNLIRYQGDFENFVLRGNGSPNQDGLYMRNLVHGRRANIRVRNVTANAFHIVGDVLSVYENLVSDMQDEGVAGEAVPARDMLVEGSTAISATTACTFSNLILENGTQYGLYLDRCDACTFRGGGAEDLPGWGVFVGPECNRVSFDGFYCELNGSGDFEIHGNTTSLENCEAYNSNSAIPSFFVGSDARNTTISNGGTSQTNIVIASGASGTIISNYVAHLVADSGTNTQLDRVSINGSPRTGISLGNSASANTRVLDWYEEGNFTPSFVGTNGGNFVYDVQDGNFTRIGDRVFFNLAVRATAASGASGTLRVSGLPYSATGSYNQAASLGDYQNLTLSTPATQLGAVVVAGTNYLELRALASGSGGVPVQASVVTSFTIVWITGSYHCA